MDKFDIRVKEFEYKYLADEIKIKDFVKFANDLAPQRQIEIGSWDVYYSGNHYDFPFEFIRLRQGEMPQLTIKIRTNDKNNNRREEINVPLDNRVSQDEISLVSSAFCGQIKFEENFRIYKYCRIFYYDKVDFVYYLVYDENMKERGRFIEIEARQDVEFQSEEEAWTALKVMEEKLTILGITAKNRTNLSLWDRYRRVK